MRRELSLVDSLASKHADMLRAMALQPQAAPQAAMGGGGLRTSGLDEEGGEAGEAGPLPPLASEWSPPLDLRRNDSSGANCASECGCWAEEPEPGERAARAR